VKEGSTNKGVKPRSLPNCMMAKTPWLVSEQQNNASAEGG
jgi:hypothetical protein